MNKLFPWMLILLPLALLAQVDQVEFIQYETAIDTCLTDGSDTFIFHGDIVNHGADTLELTVTRRTNSVPSEWSVSFCVGLACLPPFLDVYDFWIAPGDTALFSLDIFALGVVGTGDWTMFVVDSSSMEIDSSNFVLLANPSELDEIPQPSDFGLQKLFPNPTNAQMSLEFVSQKDQVVKITILNLRGEVVQQLERRAYAGRNTLPMNLDNLPSSRYIVRIGNAEQVWTKPVSVIK